MIFKKVMYLLCIMTASFLVASQGEVHQFSSKRISDVTLRVIRCNQHIISASGVCPDCQQRKQQAVVDNLRRQESESKPLSVIIREELGHQQDNLDLRDAVDQASDERSLWLIAFARVEALYR